MKTATRTLLTLSLGLVLAAAGFAQGNKPNIGQVLIVVKDIESKQEIGSVEPGGTITLPAGARVRLIMSALPTGRARGPLYPATTFSDTSRGGVVITRSNAENSTADLQLNRVKGGSRIETIRYQITDTWVPADLRTGSFNIRVDADNAVGSQFGNSRAEQLTRVLYRGILMRDLDPGARGSIDAITNGGYDALVRVAVGIANSEESRIRLAGVPLEQRLSTLYRELLGISAAQADARQWESDMRRLRDGHIGDLVEGIVTSEVFRERHGLGGVRY